jgi:hypothetical protein
MTPNNTWNADQSIEQLGGTPTSELLYHALRLARVTLGADRVPASQQYNDAMKCFTRMLGNWNALRGALYALDIHQWPTTAQQQIYQLGPGGDWDGPRPQRIARANLLFNTDPPIRRKLRIWDDADWASIALQQIYTFPSGLYNDAAAPLSNIYLRPIPDAVYQIELFTWLGLQKPVDLDTVLAYPDGWEEGIVSNLALRIGPMFGIPVSPDVRILATNSMNAINRVAATSPKLNAASDLTRGGGGGLYNWFSGLMEP